MSNSELLARLFLALAGRQVVCIAPRDSFDPKQMVYLARGDLIDHLADDNPQLAETFSTAETISAGQKT